LAADVHDGGFTSCLVQSSNQLLVVGTHILTIKGGGDKVGGASGFSDGDGVGARFDQQTAKLDTHGGRQLKELLNPGWAVDCVHQDVLYTTQLGCHEQGASYRGDDPGLGANLISQKRYRLCKEGESAVSLHIGQPKMRQVGRFLEYWRDNDGEPILWLKGLAPHGFGLGGYPQA
jgi:hypothetical protein